MKKKMQMEDDALANCSEVFTKSICLAF